MSEITIDPKKVHYCVLPEFNLDGTFDGGNPEGWQARSTVEELLDHVKDEVEEHGGVEYIYECRPILKVIRPGVKVVKLRARP